MYNYSILFKNEKAQKAGGWLVEKSEVHSGTRTTNSHITGIAMSQLYPVCLCYMLILYEAVA